MTNDHIVLATHGVLLATALVGAVSSVLNRKKLNKIEIIINGQLSDKIKTAIREAQGKP